MNFFYNGHSSFVITTNSGTTILTDPYNPNAYDNKLKYKVFDDEVDIVTISHSHADHAYYDEVKGNPIILKNTGKFTVKEVEIFGVQTYHDQEQGNERGENIVFVMKADDITIAHLGDLGHVLTSEQAAEIGAVDIVMVPVGGTYTINSQEAWEVIGQLNSKAVIPMHFKTKKCEFPIQKVDEFLTGHSNIEYINGPSFDISAETISDNIKIYVAEPGL
ncbi:MAG: MBL fold metallo-hydrolase [Armatimonadota bacterium]